MREHRNAGRTAGAHRLAIDLNLVRERLGNLLGQREAGRRLLAVDDQAELVAGEPRHHAAARRRLQPIGDQDQHLVAGRMTKHVVDFLQAVEIDAEHGEFLVGAGAGLDHLRQRLQERGAVRQIGEAVMIGHMGHPRLGLAAVGDVFMGLDQILRLAVLVEHRHPARQEQAQAVLGRDRMLFGKQAALLDRRLVARDDQLGFARVEDIGRGQPGSVLAAAVEDGFCGAVGEEITAVADALHDQRHRDVVDHELEEFLAVLELARQRAAIGDVLEQRDQKFRLVVLVARNHAVGGEDAIFRAALDEEFAAVMAFRRLQRGLVRGGDAGRGFGLEDFVRALANDVIAREAREALKRPVGENVAAILDALGGDADRNVVEHRFQELGGGGELARQLALAGAVLMRRDGSAIGQIKMLDQHRLAIGQFGDQSLGAGGAGIKRLDAQVEQPALAPHLQ